MNFPSHLSSLQDWAEHAQRVRYGDDQIYFEVEKGDYLGNQLFAYATPDEFTFAYTRKDLKITGNHPKPDCTNFFFLDSAARSNRPTEVFTVMSVDGDAAAAKCYPFTPCRWLNTDEERWEEDEKTIGLLTEKRDYESELWNLVYPGRARDLILWGLPALLMPYGSRIPVKKRRGVLHKIEDELKRFYDNGYVYSGIDFPWRHVLRDRNGKLFLSDLGSLVKVQESQTKESKREKAEKKALAVQTQMEMFMKGLGKEGKEDSQEDSDSEEDESGSESSENDDEESEDRKPAARTRRGKKQAKDGKKQSSTGEEKLTEIHLCSGIR